MESYTGTTIYCFGNAFFLNLEAIPEFIGE